MVCHHCSVFLSKSRNMKYFDRVYTLSPYNLITIIVFSDHSDHSAKLCYQTKMWINNNNNNSSIAGIVKNSNNTNNQIIPHFQTRNIFETFAYVEHILIIESIISIIINTIVISLIISKRKIRAQHSSTLLVSLFLSYICIAVSSFLIQSTMSNKISLTFALNLLKMSLVSSALNHILATLDKYKAIKEPFKFQLETCSEARLKVLLFVWLPSTIFMLWLSLMQPDDNIVEMTVQWSILSTCIILVTVNSYCLYVSISQIKRINKHRNKKRARHLKAVYSSFSSVLLFLFSWIPQTVIIVCAMVGVIDNFEKFKLKTYTVPLAGMNSMFSPMLYVFFTADIKEEARVFIQKIKVLLN